MFISNTKTLYIKYSLWFMYAKAHYCTRDPCKYEYTFVYSVPPLLYTDVQWSNIKHSFC